MSKNTSFNTAIKNAAVKLGTKVAEGKSGLKRGPQKKEGVMPPIVSSPGFGVGVGPVHLARSKADGLNGNTEKAHFKPTVLGNKTVGAPGPIFGDIAGWASAFLHRVSEFDFVAIEYCKLNGIPFFPVAIKLNLHSIAHVCRDEVIRQILISEGKGKFTLRILDWFGGGRNLKFSPQSAGPFCSIVRDGIRKNSTFHLNIEWVCGPDTPIRGDSSRSLGSLKVPIEGKFDLVVVQDVYQDGPGPNSAFSHHTAARLCEMTHFGRIYIANRMFFGMAGADDFKNGKVEQVFYRNSEGLIVSSPDDSNINYPCHPDTNWLSAARAIGRVDIVPLNEVGPYFLCRVALALENAQLLLPTVEREHLIRSITILNVGWWSWLFGSERKYQAIVHYPTVVALGLKFAVKSPNGQILDSLISEVIRRFDSDFTMKCLFKRFPSFYKVVLDGTVHACLYAGRQERATDLLGLRVSNISSERSLTVIRSSTIPQLRKNDYWRLAGVICVSLIALL